MPSDAEASTLRDTAPGAVAAEAHAADGAAAAPPPPPPAKPQRVHIGGLSRNVTAAHLSEIFAMYGELLSTELAVDRAVGLQRGYAFVEFLDAADAAKARAHLDGGQIDGGVQEPEPQAQPAARAVAGAAWALSAAPPPPPELLHHEQQ